MKIGGRNIHMIKIMKLNKFQLSGEDEIHEALLKKADAFSGEQYHFVIHN